jgi:hypothetical protein
MGCNHLHGDFKERPLTGDIPGLRASDRDREATVAALREHAVEGRLTLEEFTDRMSAAYTARTSDDLAQLVRDLPAHAAPRSRRRPTSVVLSIFGSSERDGRIRVGRRVTCMTLFGNVDLDLRQATLEQDVITIVALGVFGAIDVYVPEGIEVDLQGSLRAQTRARERRATATRHPTRTRARHLGLRRDRRLARTARLDAEVMARRDPHYQLERKLRFRSGWVLRFALNARGHSPRAPGVAGSRSSSTVRRGEASRRRGASVRLRVNRLRPAYAPALDLVAARTCPFDVAR